MISRDSAKVLVLDAVSLLGQGVIYMINLALVYYLRYSNGIPSGIVGLAASTYTLAFFLGCMFLYPIYARFSGHVLIGASFLGMSLAILALLQAEAIWLIFLCLALYGLFMSLLWAPLEAWLMDSADERSINGILGSFNLSWSLGVGLSPLCPVLPSEASSGSRVIGSDDRSILEEDPCDTRRIMERRVHCLCRPGDTPQHPSDVRQGCPSPA